MVGPGRDPTDIKLFDGCYYAVLTDTHRCQHLDDHAMLLQQEPQQNVFRSHMSMPKKGGCGLGPLAEDLLRSGQQPNRLKRFGRAQPREHSLFHLLPYTL
ncbi:MAG: hypothetical protein JWN15_748 [Firmicutes bacterium]|nr:hypothetical protein [Bacillota bacterium]